MFVALITIAVILILYGDGFQTARCARHHVGHDLHRGRPLRRDVRSQAREHPPREPHRGAVLRARPRLPAVQRLDADRPRGPAPASGLAQPAAAHRPAADDTRWPGCRRPRLSRHGAGQRLRSVDDGLLDRRGARAACRLGQGSAGPRAPGAGRRKRTQRRPRRAVLPGRCRPLAGPAVDRRHGCRRAQHGGADRLGPASPVSEPARWRACCSARRTIAGGWRDNGGRSCPWWRRCLPTWPPCGWAAAASSRPSPEG